MPALYEKKMCSVLTLVNTATTLWIAIILQNILLELKALTSSFSQCYSPCYIQHLKLKLDFLNVKEIQETSSPLKRQN